MYIKRPGPVNYTKPVDLSELSAPNEVPRKAEVVSVGDSFARHTMLHGAVTMTGLERLERNASRYGGYRRIEGIERRHHIARLDIP